jgi:glycosyltransferase involved in cell wall biosynthesis
MEGGVEVRASSREPRSERLTVFLATSGHSGVDRLMRNLVGEFARRGLCVDLLRIRNHGPYFDPPGDSVAVVPLGAAHINSSLVPLVRYLRKARPRAILCDKDRVNRIALWARRIARVPTRVVARIGTTVSVQLATSSPWLRWWQLFSMRRFYPWADAVIFPSQGAASDFAALTGFPRQRLHVIPNAVVDPELHRLSREAPGHSWLAGKGPPLILGVGELCARKDFATLIRAFARVQARKPSRLMILGEGRERRDLERLAQTLEVAGQVALPGFVTNPYAYMARANVLVLSSTGEGFGNVLAEALALGVPVVSTDCPSGPHEILRGGEVGPLVAVGDDQALARAIKETLEYPPDPAVLKEGAARYNVVTSATRYLEVLGFDEGLSKSSSSGDPALADV